MKASRNSTKHGLLASTPPLIEGEDLATFEGLLQGLVGYYHPDNPIEWHLINIIAMSIQKQHRIWMFEAAIANKELITPQRITDKKYPQYEETKFPEFRDQTEYHPDNREDESEKIAKLIEQLENRQKMVSPKSKYFQDDYKDWRQSALKAVDELWQWKFNPIISKVSVVPGLSQEKQLEKLSQEFDKVMAVHKKKSPNSYWGDLWDLKLGLAWNNDQPIPKWRIKTCAELENILTKLRNRLKELEEIATEIEQDEIKYHRTQIERENKLKPSHYFDLERLDLLKRYEAHNNRQMYQAIAKLEELKGWVD